MKPGDLVRLYSLTVDSVTGEPDPFWLGDPYGGPSDLMWPSGAVGIVLKMGPAPDGVTVLDNGELSCEEDVIFVLVNGHMGWCYQGECVVIDG